MRNLPIINSYYIKTAIYFVDDMDRLRSKVKKTGK